MGPLQRFWLHGSEYNTTSYLSSILRYFGFDLGFGTGSGCLISFKTASPRNKNPNIMNMVIGQNTLAIKQYDMWDRLLGFFGSTLQTKIPAIHVAKQVHQKYPQINPRRTITKGVMMANNNLLKVVFIEPRLAA